jgi:demethylmenaquinone methyltransferase/2-methoxy-6-polyprenyl-1,4-benzoquinol methylase
LHGIDISPAMLKQARARLSERGHEAEFRPGEVTRLPYADGQFDVVLAAHVIEHVPDPEMALAEMHRVLKPGGLVVVCVTRDTLMGRAIQTLWRTHTLDETSAKASLWRTGFRKVRALRALSTGRFDEMSIACVAEKPVGIMKSRTAETEADHV